jgi:hypothetical protein
MADNSEPRRHHSNPDDAAIRRAGQAVVVRKEETTMAYVDYDARRQEYTLRTPCLPAFVEALKEQVPYNLRTWHPGERAWTIEEDAYDEMTDLVFRHFRRPHFSKSAHQRLSRISMVLALT